MRPLHDTVALGPVSIRNVVFASVLCPLLWPHLTDHLMKEYRTLAQQGLKDFSRRLRQPLERQSNELILQMENLKALLLQIIYIVNPVLLEDGKSENIRCLEAVLL